MTISLNITDDQMKVMLVYAEMRSITIADLIEDIVERIEDEIDAKVADEAIEAHLKNPDTVTFDEAMNELGLR